MTKSYAFVAPLPLRASVTHVKGTITSRNSICVRPMTPRAQPSRRPCQTGIQMGLFGLGLPEIMVIAGVSILVFGPNKIAELGKDLGGIAGGVKKASAEFKEAMEDSLEEADREIETKRVQKEKQDSEKLEEGGSKS